MPDARAFERRFRDVDADDYESDYESDCSDEDHFDVAMDYYGVLGVAKDDAAAAMEAVAVERAATTPGAEAGAPPPEALPDHGQPAEVPGLAQPQAALPPPEKAS